MSENSNNPSTLAWILHFSSKQIKPTFLIGPPVFLPTQASIDPFWTVVQRHSYSLGAQFSPTAPSSPYKNDSAVKSLPAATQGLKASYFTGTACTGTPVLTRLDFAANFHWHAPSCSCLGVLLDAIK